MQDGVRGLFRGTAATLGREVPFYVIGMITYEQLKLSMVKIRGKEGSGLAAWYVHRCTHVVHPNPYFRALQLRVTVT